jgi:hypothetical protein
MTTPAHETTTAGRPTGGGRHCGGAGRCVPAASGGVSVATGTAGVALLLVVSDEGGIRGPCCRLNRRDRHFPGASPPVASGRLRSPPVASGRLRSPPVASGHLRSTSLAKGSFYGPGVGSGGAWVGLGGSWGIVSAHKRVLGIKYPKPGGVTSARAISW